MISPELNVVASDASVGSATVGNDTAVVSNIVNFATRSGNRAATTSRRGRLKRPGTKVGERAGAATELNDPLGISAAKRLAHVVEWRVNGGTGAEVLEARSARVE